MGKRCWTDDQLREAVASARCLAEGTSGAVSSKKA
jgi:hypothetical protein